METCTKGNQKVYSITSTINPTIVSSWIIETLIETDIDANGFDCVLNYTENTILQIVIDSLWEFF